MLSCASACACVHIAGARAPDALMKHRVRCVPFKRWSKQGLALKDFNPQQDSSSAGNRPQMLGTVMISHFQLRRGPIHHAACLRAAKGSHECLGFVFMCPDAKTTSVAALQPRYNRKIMAMCHHCTTILHNSINNANHDMMSRSNVGREMTRNARISSSNNKQGLCCTTAIQVPFVL